MTKSAAWALCTLVVLASAAALGAQGTVIAIRGVTLIDGTGRAPLPGVTVVDRGQPDPDVGTTVQAPAGATDDRRHRQVPDSGSDRRAHPSARRARRQPVRRRPGTRGRARAARLSLFRRDHGLRCRQPARIHHGAAREGTERRDRQPAHLRHRRHRRQPERPRRSLQRRSVAGRSQAARPASRHQARSRQDRPGRARLGHASADQSAAARSAREDHPLLPQQGRAHHHPHVERARNRSKRSTPAPTRWRTRSSRRRSARRI